MPRNSKEMLDYAQYCPKPIMLKIVHAKSAHPYVSGQRMKYPRKISGGEWNIPSGQIKRRGDKIYCGTGHKPPFPLSQWPSLIIGLGTRIYMSRLNVACVACAF